MTIDEIRRQSLEALARWYDAHRPSSGRPPNRSVAAIGLFVLEHIRTRFPLSESDYLTAKNQVAGAGDSQLRRILARYGERRRFLAEAGRTTRSSVVVAQDLVTRLNALESLQLATVEDRIAVVDAMQRWLVDRIQDYFNSQRIEVEFDVGRPGALLVADLLVAADRRKVAGAVAQHLVGAKLALRYPDMEVENHSYTTADQQLGRHGDFLIGDTVFHVTVHPAQGHAEKCGRNLRDGFRAVLLVPEALLQPARYLVAQADVGDRVWVTAIESFVGQNVEEMSAFGQRAFPAMMRSLLERYNRRVEAVETDRSLLIDIPSNLG